MERRRNEIGKATPLPPDYLKLVSEVFTTNFDGALKALNKLGIHGVSFEAMGEIYSTEVTLCISITQKGKLSATSVHASCDFDPKASSPTVEDLLSSCVDAIGSLYGTLLEPSHSERLEAMLAENTLSVLENIPFNWTPIEVDRHRVFLKLDKTNPGLESMADEWLTQKAPKKKDS